MNINFNNIDSQSSGALILKERRYGVSVKYYSGNAEVPQKRIDYDVEIQIDDHENGWQIRIDKQNVFFNQHKPDLISEILSQAITNSIYPVECVINSKGIPVRGITNHEEILKRWDSNKKKIADKYVGETVEEFMTAADRKFSNKALIEKSMKYDMLWNLLFHPKYQSYGSNKSIQTDMHLSVAPYQFPVRFSGIQSLNEAVTTYNSVQVKFNSDEMESPEFLTATLKNANHKYFVKLEVVFDLDAKHFFLMHATACFNLYYKDDEQHIHSEKKIHFTMYQLGAVSQTDQYNIIVNEEPKNKKSKLMRFIDALVGD
ncbi:hypothetical protein G6M26_06980 [Agrobacterium tumefaciens]|nr:hypothetical protein [Agrobacterium tumefaciens]